jgi:LysM repeat protein
MDTLHHLKFFAVFLAVSLTVGCGGVTDSPLTPSPLKLKPYATATHNIVSSATLSTTDIPLPSPTPSTYRVEAGDSLGTIAEKFGMHLADLQTANPGVESESLTVGQKINIPVNSANAPIPAPVELSAVKCYPAGEGTYCFVKVHNPFAEMLENVKLQMTVLDAKGHIVDNQEAFLPLNILPPGSSLPAYVLFASLPAGTLPVAQVADSIRLAPGDQRYLPAVTRNLLISIAWDGRSARVQGQVALPAAGKTPRSATTLWLAAVAYDADGQIVGFRRWEWQGNLKPGNTQGFDFSVYSLGPAIETVNVIVEARP